MYVSHNEQKCNVSWQESSAYGNMHKPLGMKRNIFFSLVFVDFFLKNQSNFTYTTIKRVDIKCTRSAV